MITKLQYLTQKYPGWTHTELAHAACTAGVDWIQLRMKDENEFEVIAAAKEIRSICTSFNAKFILNDFVEIAAAVNADGVHLGTNDMSMEKARDLLGPNKIIGGTANTLQQVLALIASGADYIGLGPFRHTNTKKKLDPIIGPVGVESIFLELKKRKLKIPIVVIGGIRLEDIKAIHDLGANGVAVSGLLTKAIVEGAARSVVNKTNEVYNLSHY